MNITPILDFIIFGSWLVFVACMYVLVITIAVSPALLFFWLAIKFASGCDCG